MFEPALVDEVALPISVPVLVPTSLVPETTAPVESLMVVSSVRATLCRGGVSGISGGLRNVPAMVPDTPLRGWIRLTCASPWQLQLRLQPLVLGPLRGVWSSPAP